MVNRTHAVMICLLNRYFEIVSFKKSIFCFVWIFFNVMTYTNVGNFNFFGTKELFSWFGSSKIKFVLKSQSVLLYYHDYFQKKFWSIISHEPRVLPHIKKIPPPLFLKCLLIDFFFYFLIWLHLPNSSVDSLLRETIDVNQGFFCKYLSYLL